MANVTFKADVAWSGQGLVAEGNARGFRIAVDEPVELGGTNKYMNPVEMVLCALGGCISICAAAFARGCQVDIKGFRVELEGDLDPDGFTGKNHNVRTGFQQIRVRMHIDSPSPKANVDRLLNLIKQRCPVSDTLSGVEIMDQTVT